MRPQGAICWQRPGGGCSGKEELLTAGRWQIMQRKSPYCEPVRQHIQKGALSHRDVTVFYIILRDALAVGLTV